LPAGVPLIVHTEDVGYGIAAPGEFKVYAMYALLPTDVVTFEDKQYDNVWSGRVVSKPVVVEIVAPPAPDRPAE
jgi:hypothetical protein